jgi:hypothetical protein
LQNDLPRFSRGLWIVIGLIGIALFAHGLYFVYPGIVFAKKNWLGPGIVLLILGWLTSVIGFYNFFREMQ